LPPKLENLATVLFAKILKIVTPVHAIVLRNNRDIQTWQESYPKEMHLEAIGRKFAYSVTPKTGSRQSSCNALRSVQINRNRRKLCPRASREIDWPPWREPTHSSGCDGKACAQAGSHGGTKCFCASTNFVVLRKVFIAFIKR